MIYFNNLKEAFAFEIENPICIISDDIWAKYADTDKWDIIDGIFTDISNTEDYKEQEAQQEAARVAQLKLTKREVFLGLYQAKGITPDQIKAQISAPESLIEFEYANDYYRGNPLIDTVGLALGLTSTQLDNFFKSGGDYTTLLPDEDTTANEGNN